MAHWPPPDMNQPDSNHLRPYLPVLLLLFVGSGCAALIYEIVWFQLLQLAIGSSAVSLGVLLGTYMGGMCLGSLLLPRFVSRGEHPLRVYARLELGIGIFAIVVLFLIPLLDSLYAAIASHGLQGIVLRAVVAAICLLPPTLLMGASLPAMARWVEATPQGVSWLGFLYGGNIAGAVFGCLFAGFYLLRVYDMPMATYVAAAINFAVALDQLHRWPKRTEYRPYALASRRHHAVLRNGLRVPGRADVYIAIALSGMCALGAEVIWTRLLSLMIGATVVHVLDHSGGVPDRTGTRQRGRLGSWPDRGRARRWAGARCSWPAPSRGPRIRSPIRSPTGPSIRCSRPARGSIFRSIWCAACGPSCLRRSCGARAFRWRWPRPHRSGEKDQDPENWSGDYAANTVGAIVGAIAFSMHFYSLDRLTRTRSDC